MFGTSKECAIGAYRTYNKRHPGKLSTTQAAELIQNMSRPNAHDDDSRRTRVYVACLNCRKRKTKCITDSTADKPCMRCVQQGLKCTYAPIDHADSVSTSGPSSSQQSNPPYSNPFTAAPTSGQQYTEHYGGVAQGGSMLGHVSQQPQFYGTQSAPAYQQGFQEMYAGQQGLYEQGFAQAGGYYSGGGHPTMNMMTAQGYQCYAGPCSCAPGRCPYGGRH
ncbi:hypothetical protein C8F01DRAFT_99275 [Mycena amicta]|nr:hypothetical protein C8F01DRAFT_99275 [Mycena amicta]